MVHILCTSITVLSPFFDVINPIPSRLASYAHHLAPFILHSSINKASISVDIWFFHAIFLSTSAFFTLSLQLIINMYW